MKFETFGIHTRLHYIIKGVGGIDVESRKNYLKKKYGYEDAIINKIYKYTDVEKMLEKISIEECLDKIEQLEEKKRLEKLNNIKGFSCFMRGLDSLIESGFTKSLI